MDTTHHLAFKAHVPDWQKPRKSRIVTDMLFIGSDRPVQRILLYHEKNSFVSFFENYWFSNKVKKKRPLKLMVDFWAFQEVECDKVDTRQVGVTEDL